MRFLTEEDIRARCPNGCCALALESGEHLTPSASEYAASQRITISRNGAVLETYPCAKPGSIPTSGSPSGRATAPAGSASSCSMTWLDEKNQVSKTHPRIVLRGKLDSLLAMVTLVQTQFDPKDRLPVFLKECLADVNVWVMQILAAEVGGHELAPSGMGGLSLDILHTVSREPVKYLGMEHCMAEASLGGNIALVNWLRAVVRETEIEALRCLPDGGGICHALNRLSSALYVLMLLTLAAQQGKALALDKTILANR